MEIQVINIDSQNVGSVTLDDAIFGVKPRQDIIHRVMEWQRAKARSGNHKTKGISDISGTTKKPWAQKGTGRARQGSLRSPQFRGGAVIFGPVVRSHEYSMNKKVRKLALKMIISAKLLENKCIILNDFELKSHKTAALNKKLMSMGVKSAIFLGLDNEKDTNFSRACKNIKGMDTISMDGINVYSIISREHLVIGKDSIAKIQERLA